MSEIANALAKAKERTGQTSAPFMMPGAAPAAIDPARAAAAAAAIRKARRTQRFWFILIAITLPATVYLVWSRLRPNSDAKITLSEEASAVGSGTTSPEPVGDSVTGHGQNPGSVGTSSQAPVTTPAAPLPTPRADLMARVSDLSVAAVTPGNPPRIVIAGRIIRQGQALDADLTFSDVTNGQIIFTDGRGAVYVRRY